MSRPPAKRGQRKRREADEGVKGVRGDEVEGDAGGEVREGGAKESDGRKKRAEMEKVLRWEEDVLQTEGEDTEERMCHSE